MTNSKYVKKHAILAGDIFIICNNADGGINRMKFITHISCHSSKQNLEMYLFIY